MASLAPAATPPETRDRALKWLIGATLLTRLAAFPFTQNLFGDAVVRAELAQRWAEHPHLITHFKDGVFQFGPLHIYLMGLGLMIWNDRETCTRLISLVLGVLTVIPLYRLTRRLFDRTSALWAGAAFACWGVHIQSSTTAGSEALCLFLFAWATQQLMEGIEEMRFGPLAWSALCMNLACATRYDMWMYAPLFTLVVAFSGANRVAAFTRAIMYGGLCLIYPLLWMEGNEQALGDPLYAIHFIDDFHRTWTRDGVKWLGEARMRLWGAGFWPGSLVLTLSPLYGLLCLGGVGRAFARKEKRTLAVLAAVPTAYYTLRSAVLLNFSPLARFTLAQLFLCMPYAWYGLEGLTSAWTRAWRRGLVVATTGVMILTPASIAALSYRADAGWGHYLKPVSPVSTMPLDQMETAHWLKERVAPGEGVVMDCDDNYRDIGPAFFSGLPEAQLDRVRWENFDDRLKESPPQWVVLIKNGKLSARPGVKLEGDTLDAFGRTFHLAQRFNSGAYAVYSAK